MTDENRFKQLLVDAICGVGFPSVFLAQECEKVGMATFTGNRHNHIWEWDRRALLAITTGALQELYDGLCEERERNFTPTDPVDDYPGIIVTQ